MDVTVRLDYKSAEDVELLKKFLDKYDRFLVYEETGAVTKKLHYQGIIRVQDDKELNAIKSRFSTMFPDHKGGSKSMSKVKSKNYEVYITKDKKIFYRKGYTDEEVQELEEKSYKKSEGTSGSTSFTRAVQYCKDHGINIHSSGWEIAETLIEYYRETCRCEPNDFQIKNMAKSIYTQLIFQRSVEMKDPNIYKNFRTKRAKQIIGTEWISA